MAAKLSKFKRFLSVFLLLSVLGCFYLGLYSDTLKVKADTPIETIMKIILTAYASDGTVAATTSLDPEGVLALAGLGIMAGVSFHHMEDVYNYCQHIYQNAYNTNTDWGKFINFTTSSAKSIVQFNADTLTWFKNQIIALKAAPSVSMKNVAFTLSFAGTGTQTFTKKYTMNPSRNYTFHFISAIYGSNAVGHFQLTNDIIQSATGNFILGWNDFGSTDSTNKFTTLKNDQYATIVAYTNAIGCTLGYNTSTVTVTYPCDVNLQIQGNPNIPCDVGIRVDETGNIVGDYTGTNADASSKDSSVSLDHDVSVSIPTANVNDIPASTVIGTDAASFPDTIARDISGTISNADAVPGTPTYDPPSTSLNLQPLLGLDLSDRFPFCLPFDLVGSIQALSASATAPKWTINFDKSYYVGGGQLTIDFSQFELWAKIIRYFLLLAFVVTLILVTRKLIGS